MCTFLEICSGSGNFLNSENLELSLSVPNLKQPNSPNSPNSPNNKTTKQQNNKLITNTLLCSFYLSYLLQ